MPNQGLEMWIWRVLLWLSVQLRDPASIQTIDAPVFDWVAAKRHNANRTNYSFRSVKTAALVDRKNEFDLDIHCLMKQPFNIQFGWQVLKRNHDRVETLTDSYA